VYRAGKPDPERLAGAGIRDPSLVPVSIAQCIGLQDARGGTLLQHLSSYLVAFR
jgi:hypothetical protein